ncbi:MAG TPA: Crp/Fnr family transcriptional regulator [Pyrinomonadaceae bacterium]|nr:Crp/Fnr family transcriptional regulator [Pyrinomonadaceae bacterium]
MSQPSADPRPVNSLLAALPEAEYRRLAAHLKPVSLKRGQVLHEADTPAQYVYFLDEGVASLSVSSAEGQELMLSIAGYESIIGERAIFKEGHFIIRCQMLTDGRGHRMLPEAFDEEFKRGERLHQLVLNRMEARTTETAQTALCNQMHTVEQRLARWLLTLADRLHSDELLVTHEHMADMVGVRRAGITDAVGIMRETGLIESGRGTVAILERGQMEAQACECYAIIREAIETFST